MFKKLGLLVLCQFAISAHAGLNETTELIKVGDSNWRAICADDTVDRVSTDDILADAVCGGASEPEKGCLDIAKEALPYSQYNTAEELNRLASACRSGRRGMAPMLTKMIEVLPYSQYNTNQEMVTLIESASPGHAKGGECLNVTTNALPYSQYNTNGEMATLAAACGPYRRAAVQCLESALRDLPYSQYNTLPEMVSVVENCQ
ncbi:MAG: hypothetical protein AAF202_05755 [Pseudomonadota bacterium]